MLIQRRKLMQTCYETKRLILKILTPDKCNSVLRFYKDNQELFEPLNPVTPKLYYTTDYQRSALTIEYQRFLEGKSARYYVYLKDNPSKIIGTLSFSDIRRDFYQSAVIGYRFDKRFHRQGFATECLQKGIHALFTEEKIHRIEAYIQPFNVPSKQLIERLGFRFEGTCFDHTMVQNKWQDMERYSLISTDLHQ